MEQDVGTQIRVVRCPKCEKLLPEMPSYSVYLCGNCGATLQAKKLNKTSDSSPEKSDGENLKYVEVLDPQFDKNQNPSTNPVINVLIESDKQIKKPEPIIPKESSSPIPPKKSSPITKSPKIDTEMNQTKYRRKNSNLNSKMLHDEGPSDYNHNQNKPNPNPQIETLEQDRANLLKMLEEIRDQVQKSCEISGKPNSGFQNPGIPNPRTQNPVLTSPRIPEPPSRPRSGYNVGVPNHYYPPHTNSNYTWRNQENYYYDPLISYHHEGFYHQPSCACLHCFPRDIPVSVPVPYQSYHPRSSNNSPNLINRQINNNRRGNFGKRNCRQCQPLAGASPFVVCYNCFELLQVPKRSPIYDNKTNKKTQVKLRCGSCSHAMVLKLNGNELLIIQNDNENETNVPNYDNKKFGDYNFLSGNYENDTRSQKSRSESNKSEKELVSRVPSLPLREHLNESFSEKGNISARSEQEKMILYSENMNANENFRQNSVKDVPVVPVRVEMDVSADEYPYPVLSQESYEGQNNNNNNGNNNEEERENDDDEVEERENGGKNGGDSFFANFFKKSFKGGNNGNNKSSRVSVNGYVISDKAVKKAEKYAGPISPGDYWYDYRAGFWGVIGYHCLGMIPPYIEEFNYPMQKSCAGGNTNVTVNGRELNRKDLELLTGRGLPGSPGFSYRVEASGKVWDEDTNEELYSLGKLAPTVEKMRRGFGMRVPRVIS